MTFIGRHLPRILFLLLLGGAIMTGYVFSRLAPGKFTVAFLDVGQGDAIFIEGPSGNQILLDAGPPDGAVLRELPKVMPFFDRSLDLIILSHPHADHLGGFPEVLRRYRVTSAVDPGVQSATPEYRAYVTALEISGAKRLAGRRGLKIYLDETTVVEVLLPVVNDADLSPHNGMLVLRLVSNGVSVFLTGDMEKNMENYLLHLSGSSAMTSLQSDILKVGHHGSRTSTSAAFLAAVDPSYAVVSAGAGNTYGHPHLEVVERLRDFGARLYRTDEDDTVIFRATVENGLRAP